MPAANMIWRRCRGGRSRANTARPRLVAMARRGALSIMSLPPPGTRGARARALAPRVPGGGKDMMDKAPLLAIATSLGLAVFALLRPPRHLRQIMFAAGMVAFAVESFLVDRLLSYAMTPESQAFWMQALQSATLVTPVPWCLFAFLAGRDADASVPSNWRHSFVLGGSGLVAAALANLAWPFFSDMMGAPGFLYAETTLVGQIGVVIELLSTIAVLYGLEPSLRNTRGSLRWRLKYLTLGLGAIFAVRFYLLSQVLLFHALDRSSLVLRTISIVIGEIFVAVGLLRSGVLRTDLTVSRHFVYRSIVVGLCGVYLFLAGAAGWLMNVLGIP